MCVKPVVFPGQYNPSPCGQCWQCRARKQSDWTVRLWHEYLVNEGKCAWTTLSYAPEYEQGTLCYNDIPDFMRRLRKLYPGKKIRYFASGEYGDLKLREHWHILLFGLSVDKNLEENIIRCWPYGSIDEVVVPDIGQIKYCAKYCVKKLTGKFFDEFYKQEKKLPELVRMSRRPGIGAVMRDNQLYINQWFKDGFVRILGKKYLIPRYYVTEERKEVYREIMKSKSSKRLEKVLYQELSAKKLREEDERNEQKYNEFKYLNGECLL